MRNDIYRCQHLILNKSNNKKYRCNHGYYKYFTSIKLCWAHYNKYAIKYILLIQKIYRAYRCRRYLKIYKKLPNDLQLVIKKKISAQYYYKLYCKSIYKIINNRYIILRDEFSINFINKYRENNHINKLFIYLFIDNIYPVYYLYDKYFPIISITKNSNMLLDIKILHINSYSIINFIRTILQEPEYYNINLDIDNNIYIKLINSIFIINSLSEKYHSLCE